MHFAKVLVLLIELASGMALPKALRSESQLANLDLNTLQGLRAAEISSLLLGENIKGEVTGAAGQESEKAAGEGAAAEGAATGEAEGEGEGNEVDLPGTFDQPVELQGGDVKQDTLFTKSAIGAFEYEFAAATGDTLTVSENKTPGPPPSGFVAIEPSSFKVALAQSKGAGLTTSKIDYIFDTASPALTGIDIAQAKVGRLCGAVGSFVIDESLGELEFEAEENEISLSLSKNVTAEGEWGIFVPATAVAAAFTSAMRASAENATTGK